MTADNSRDTERGRLGRQNRAAYLFGTLLVVVRL